MMSSYALYIKPAWFRRFLADLVPDPNFQKLKEMVYSLDENSRKILKSKQDAFLRGDEALKEQVDLFQSEDGPREVLEKIRGVAQKGEYESTCRMTTILMLT